MNIKIEERKRCLFAIRKMMSMNALANENADEICINLLMGHKETTVQQIYSHKTLAQLKEAILKLW